MTVLLSPARRCLDENSPMYYPFGSKLSRNALLKYKGQEKPTKVLFLGCLDLKNVLETVAFKTDSETSLNIHLNHSCPVSLARNVLILKVISATDFNINCPEDLNYLWDLWYNLEWPKSTLERFIDDVKSLINNGLSEEISFAPDSYKFDEMQGILQDWLSSATGNRVTESSQRKKILMDRKQFISNGGLGELSGIVAKAAGLGHITSSKNLALRRVAAMVTQPVPRSLNKKLYQENKVYCDTGYCSSSKKNSVAAVNPTLLEPKTLSWRVDVVSCPFDSYLPLPLDELETSAEDCIVTRYCQKVLKNLVATYREKQKSVHFYIHSGDDFPFCLSNTSEKFDVIDSSTLADKVGLANLIVSASQRLEHHPDAVLLTESILWDGVASSVALYLEELLCAPLSMIPTIYGLRLTSPVELGSATLQDKDTMFACPPVTLSWRPAPRSENLPVSNSISLEDCLKKLAKKCFYKEEEKDTKGNVCGLNRCTPLTFNLVTTRLVSLGFNHEILLKLFQPQIPPRFMFAQRSLDAWTYRRPVSLVTATQLFTPLFQSLFHQNKMVFPGTTLRIVLVPSNRYVDQDMRSSSLHSFNWAAEIPRVHYIDNFHLVHHRNPDGSFRSLQVSFLLPQEHGLEDTHCGVLVDLESGTTMMYIGAIKDMQQQDYDVLHPIAKSSLPEVVSPYPRVLKCEESVNDFTLQIDTNTDVLEGYEIVTDQELPCEAANTITFVFTKPEGLPPLSLFFPYPVLIEGLAEGVQLSGRLIQLVLKKALHEPWPCHFKEEVKWNVEEFTTWNPEGHESPLTVHLVAGQIDSNSLMFSDLKLTSPLEEVRGVISQIFCSLSEYHTIVLSDSNNETTPKKEIWLLRVHLPLRNSPSGSPMLLISALDQVMAEKRIANGDSEAEEICEEFSDVFCEDSMKILSVNTEEAATLLRYVLRLNSTKVIPTPWQQENLSLGGQSPVLATFLTPLYLDNQFGIDEEDEDTEDEEDQLRSFEDMLGVPTFNPGRCARCGVQSNDTLKRCSKCKVAYYCTVDCQRADWTKHKIACALLES